MRPVPLDITDASSPNFDDRTLPIAYLVLHYTGMESGAAALARMCDAQAKVSAHYMIEEDGRIFRLVDEERRCLLYTSPSPRDRQKSRMPSSA